MTAINTNNSISSSTTYSTNNSSQSEIKTLQEERQSLQKEVQGLQSDLASNSSDSQTIQVEIDTLQSQISTIDSQIASLQSKNNEKTSNNSQSDILTKINDSENPEILKNSLGKLDETTKILENEIALDKGRGLNTENKDEILENIKKNIDSISSKPDNFDEDSSRTSKVDYQTNLVGNLVDNRA